MFLRAQRLRPASRLRCGVVESGLTQTDEIGRGRIREQSSGETGDEGLMLSLLAAWSLRSVQGFPSFSKPRAGIRGCLLIRGLIMSGLRSSARSPA